MLSILDNTDAPIDFYILDSGISPENEEKIRAIKGNYSINFLKIDVEKQFKGFNVPGHLNLSTYSRLLIPSLKPELEKVLYIDTDVVALGNIAELYNVDLGNYALGAAWDKSRVLYNTDTKEPLELSDDYKYFNAGVLLIDIQKWIRNEVVKSLFEIQRKYDGKIPHADETLLNKYFDGNYKIFDISWDYTDYDLVNAPDKEIKIRHFASSIKPWNSNYTVLGKKIVPLKNFEDFWKYAKMTKFYEEIKKKYETSINLSPIKKRMSRLVQEQSEIIWG